MNRGVFIIIKNVFKWLFPIPKGSPFKIIFQSLFRSIFNFFHQYFTKKRHTYFHLSPLGVGAKKMKIDSYRPISFLLVLIFFSSCQKEPVETIYFDFSNQSGIFIVNEGSFMYGNASLSYHSPSDKRTYQNIFSSRNKAPLGDVAQSMKLQNGLAWMVINNSGKIYVADENTMEFRGSITGLNSPRYIEFF